MIAKLIPALAQHRETRPMIMGSYSHPLSGKGWYGSCSCGWQGPGRGETLGQRDCPQFRQAQNDADEHLASVIIAQLIETSAE